MEQILLLAFLFLIVSIVFSMIGMGGGILYVPILLFAGYGMAYAPGISLILIVATSLGALSNFWKNKKIDWKLALVIDPPTNVTAFVGGYFSASIPESILRSVLVVVLMISGTLMLKNRKGSLAPHEQKEHWWLWHRKFNGEHYTVNLPLVLTVTALVGLLSGMLGITGGIIKLPVMVLLCGVPMDIAVATSTVMVALTALCGIAGHALNGTLKFQTGMILAIVALIGGLIGSHISLSVDKAKLKKIFGIIVWLIACRILFELFFL